MSEMISDVSRILISIFDQPEQRQKLLSILFVNESEMLAAIDFTGSETDFVDKLVPQLINHEVEKQGKTALIVLLEWINDQSSENKEEVIKLIALLESTSASDHLEKGEVRKALACFERALLFQQKTFDRSSEATTLSNIGRVWQRLGELRKALDFFEQSLPLHREVGNRSGEADTLGNIGRVWQQLGDPQKALAYFEQSLPLQREVGNRSGEAIIITNIGQAWQQLGDPQRALEYFELTLPLRRAVGDRSGEATSLSNIGIALHQLGEPQRALEYFERALPIQQSVGDQSGEANSLHNIGMLHLNLGEPKDALHYFERLINLDPTNAQAYSNRGVSYAELGNEQRALADFEEVLRLDPTNIDAYLYKGVTLANKGRLQEALSYFEQAAKLGDTRAKEYEQKIRQAIEQPVSASTPSGDPQAAFEAFLNADSPSKLQKAVAQFPVLAHMIPTIETVIREQVSSELRPAFQQRLAWLSQIINGEVDISVDDEQQQKDGIDSNISHEDNKESKPRDEVRFRLYSSPKAQVAKRSSLLVYAFVPKITLQIESDVKRFENDLGGSVPTPKEAKQVATVARETPITVIPESDELEFEPQSLTKKWYGDWTRYNFDFRPGEDLIDETIFVRISIQISGIEIAHIKCAIDVIETGDKEPDDITPTTNPLLESKMKSQTVTPYQRIFISYSRRDSSVAKSYKVAQTALGNDAFLDVDNLRAGEDWRAALARAIDEADIFQLFWSEHSASSEYCRYEWDYALKVRCPDDNCEGFIRPVYWRKPMPSPPSELSRINFRFVPFED